MSKSKSKDEKEDLYAILGVSKKATDDEIKKAYRKQAVKWHPDKNPDKKAEAQEMFKKIGEAYSVLSNKDQRQIYDTYGYEGLRQGGGQSQQFHDFPDMFGGSDPFKVFEHFFKNSGFGFEDDDDFGFFFGRNKQTKNGSNNSKKRDPFGFGGFDDDFMGGGFGGGFSQFQSSSFGGGLGGVGTSVSTSTIIKNGQKVTVTKKTTRKPDGTTEVVETVNQGGKVEEKRYQLEDRKNGDNENKKYIKRE